MILIKEENDNTNTFYKRVINTKNNMFLCKSEKIIKNEIICNNQINYNLEKKLSKYNYDKINKILEKIETNMEIYTNIKYYKFYFKEKNKKRKKNIENYKHINSFTKKILYNGKKNKLLNKANHRRLIENKSQI